MDQHYTTPDPLPPEPLATPAEIQELNAIAADFARAGQSPARTPIAIGLGVAVAAVLILAWLFRAPRLIVAILGVGALTLLADALMIAAWTPSYLTRRVVGHARFLTRREWLVLIGSIVLVLVLLVLVLNVDFLVLGPVVAMLLAGGYFLAVQHPTARARAAVLDRLEPLLRAMRLRGATDADIARTMALTAAPDWEGLVEMLFGHAAVLAARRSSDFRLLPPDAGLAHWRQRVLETLDRREERWRAAHGGGLAAGVGSGIAPELGGEAAPPAAGPAPSPGSMAAPVGAGSPVLVRRGAPRLFGPNAELVNAVPNTAGPAPGGPTSAQLGIRLSGCLALLVGPAMRLLVGSVVVLVAVALHDGLVPRLINPQVDGYLATGNALFAGAVILVTSLIRPRLVTALFLAGAVLGGPVAIVVGVARLDPLARLDLAKPPIIDRVAEGGAAILHHWQLLGQDMFAVGVVLVLAGCGLALVRGLLK